jgi:hypothetical protein
MITPFHIMRIFGPRGDEVAGAWRKLHNEKLRDLYSSPSVFSMMKRRRMRWAGHVARMKKRNACRLLMGKLVGRSPQGKPRHKGMNNIKMDLGEMEQGNMDWIGLAQDTCKWRALLVSVVKNLLIS